MITIKFKKGRAYPTLISTVRVMSAALVRFLIKGYIQVKVWYPKDSLYLVDKTDQSDVLKLVGFKSIKQVKPKNVPYMVSDAEKMVGWRRKYKTDNFMEFGVHERVDGERLPFDPTITKVYPDSWVLLPKLTGFKWGYLPVGPYFGGHDSNGDGLGGEAPKDLILKIQFV